MKNRPHIRDVFKNIGAKSIIAALLVFLLTVAAACVGGVQLYNSAEKSIALQGEVNTAEFCRTLYIVIAVLIILALLEVAVFIAVSCKLSAKNLEISAQNVRLGAIGDMYTSIRDIDLRTDSIRSVRRDQTAGSDDTAGSKQTGAADALREFCEKNVRKTSKEDMISFVDLSTVPARLQNTDTVAVEYPDDQNAWRRARFLAAERDADGKAVRVLWLIEPIDEEKKDRDRLKALSETDPMTGVRSKRAYLLKEKELNEEIKSKHIEEFAIVVCDVNGLKKINDTYGHKAGDEYIRESCSMVCDIFRHSPVYRVGGDEFAVILTGSDFAVRNELMIALHNTSANHITAGGAVISAGLSEFRPGADESIHDVFRRADGLMYEEKKLLKSLGAVIRDDESDKYQDAELSDQRSIIKVKHRLLIVDDESINREILSEALSSSYDLVFASDGYEALQQMHAHKDDLALILLDLIMPRLNGVEVLKTMKNDGDIRDIPVIVMTSDQNAELECLKLGVMDFISKPYPNREIIRTRVNKYIELAEDRDIIRATERDSLTTLFNIDYFRRYVQTFDRNDWDTPMDAVAVDVSNYRNIVETRGKSDGDKMLRSLGERLRTLARELSGIGGRQDVDTFLVYCPHREDYPDLLHRLSENIAGNDPSAEQVELRIGVYASVDKKTDVDRRFENAKAAIDSIKDNESAPVGFYGANR